MRLPKKDRKAYEYLRLISPNYQHKNGIPKLNTHNDILHELAKCKVVYLTLKEKYLAYMECRFTTGGIADVFIPNLGIVVEILFSEKLVDAKKKTEKYPKGLTILYLKAEDVLKDDFILF